MANTYTQLCVHFVFAVKFREGVISKHWKDKLYAYITGIVKAKEHKLLVINGMPDHVHILIDINPNQSISELAKDIKANSSKWVNMNRFVRGRFEWQHGYGAFVVSHDHKKNTIKYIENQELHHQVNTFRSEFIQCLDELNIQFDSRYIFGDLV
jgi:REP element-mobilizing transposase RayT